jgi:hypothetical protein
VPKTARNGRKSGSESLQEIKVYALTVGKRMPPQLIMCCRLLVAAMIAKAIWFVRV